MDVGADTPEKLMLAYQNGSVEAFEQLFKRSSGRVRLWLKRRVPSDELADDLTQKVFFKLHRSRHQFRVEEVFDAWLFSIVRSVWSDEMRSRARKPDTSSALPIDEVPESKLISAEEESGSEIDWEAAVLKLPPIHREALDLRYQDGESFGGLARRWKISEAAARQRVSRAVRELREILERVTGQDSTQDGLAKTRKEGVSS
jgi:RNA polymerase sigma-70 factor (ECF subfamily)